MREMYAITPPLRSLLCPLCLPYFELITANNKHANTTNMKHNTIQQHQTKTGKQAEVLNQVVDELLDGHPVSDVKLKEVLGHTPLQVCAGAVLGVLFGAFFPVPQPGL